MTNLNDSPDSMTPFAFVENAPVGQTDTMEWVVIHSTPDSLSPPMLAKNWEQAKLLFNSVLDASLMMLAGETSCAAVVCLESNPERLRLGVFTQYGRRAVPNQMFLLMDKRQLTQELYDKWYLDGHSEPHENFVWDIAEPDGHATLH